MTTKTSKKKTMRKSAELSDVQKLVQRLLKKGHREIDIAAKLNVHYVSVIRWRDGLTEPHASHLNALREMNRTAAPKQKKSA